MTDASFTPPSERELLVVYPTRQRAEVREELSQAWIVPNAGVVAPKESVRGTVAVGVVATLISLAVAIPLAFVDFVATFGVRLIWFSVIAIALGGTVGLVAGAAAPSTTSRRTPEATTTTRPLTRIGPPTGPRREPAAMTGRAGRPGVSRRG